MKIIKDQYQEGRSLYVFGHADFAHTTGFSPGYIRDNSGSMHKQKQATKIKKQPRVALATG